MRFGLGICFVLLVAACGFAQEPKKAVLIIARVDQKNSYTRTETVNLTVTIENRGTSPFYIYHPLEWGWTGLWFGMLDANGNRVRLKQPIVPLPPPPLGDKSELVSKLVELEPGYFYGKHIDFALSDYDLKSGMYSIAFMYHSYYNKSDGFGLPILTWDDGEIVSNKIQVSIR